MCSLFGLIDYKHTLSGNQKSLMLSVLATECEVRGTDATGIAYNSRGKLQIFKKAVPAHEMKIRIPGDAHVIMGHTRMTTQGSEKIAANNHPFPGNVPGKRFALAHNGVLYNDTYTEIDHTVTFQDSGLLIERQKSYTLFRKRSKLVVTQSVPYSTIQSVRLNTSMSMTELITSVGFGILGLIYLFDGSVFWGLFWLVLCALAVKAGIRTMVTICTSNGAPVRISYSGKDKELAMEFAKSICLITGVSMPSI